MLPVRRGRTHERWSRLRGQALLVICKDPELGRVSGRWLGNRLDQLIDLRGHHVFNTHSIIRSNQALRGEPTRDVQVREIQSVGETPC